MPNAGDYVDRFFQSFPNVCSVFPPYHAGQTRVVEFLKALRSMPGHQAPNYFYDNNMDDLRMLTLWPSGIVSIYRAYRQTVPVGLIATSSFGSGIGTPGSEPEARWHNYQSAMARITMADFSNCDLFSASRRILPIGKDCPSWEVCDPYRLEEFGGHIQAAAQWVPWPEEVRYVYQQCKKKNIVDKENNRDTWSMENWRNWRAQFEFFAVEDKIDPRARRMAQRATEKMKEAEDGSC